MEEINDCIKNEIHDTARNSIRHLEPICQECWDKGEDDPLGIVSGVNTPANKKINSLCERIIDNSDEADHTWHSNIRNEIVDLFYDYYNEEFQRRSLKSDGTLECFYCYNKRKSSDDNLGIRVKEPSEHPMFHRSEYEWR